MESETFNIEITRNGEHVSIDFDPNMPFLLADRIKEIVREFYKKK